MEKSNGIKLGVIVGILSLFFCSSLIIQISFAEEIELKSVGRGAVSCQGGEEIKNVRINFFVSSDKGTSFAEWNIDHENLAQLGESLPAFKLQLKAFL